MKWTSAILALAMLSGCSRGGITQPSPAAGGTMAASGAAYAVNGWVHDTAGRPIDGALLEVLSGSNTGATSFTDRDGSYAFSQAFTAVPSIRATKSGYQTENSNVFVLNNSTVIRGLFRLGSPTPPIDLDGTYQFTFSVDPSCTALPAAARKRSYDATVADGRSVFHLVTLRGARFAPSSPSSYGAWNAIYVSVFENFVRFDFSDPPIWELLNDPSSVYMTGFAAGTVNGPISVLPMSGEFEFCGSATGDDCHDELSCTSTNHTLTVTRR